ncbi:MAG: glycosyltransferase family 1 protein [Candidatus Promineifilaceae bacterium]|nr:glycosyltransferase family 1 protein [Candidatus Promineifilaceae bacterium]
MIYLDISAAVHSRAGLGRYSEQLALALLQENEHQFGLFYNQGKNGQFPSSLPSSTPQRRVPLDYKPWRMAVLAGHKSHIAFNRLLPDATLFHSTEHLLLPLREVPTVLTVHDLIFKHFPAYHKKLNYWYLNQAMPLYCRQATAIIAVSESTKQDIITQYHVAPGKIHVIYEAASSHFQPPNSHTIDRVRKQYRLPEQFLIHLSTIEPRKNLNRLLDSLLILRQSFPELVLVLAGSKGWLYEDFFTRIDAQGLSHMVQSLGWVPDEDLPAILAAADLAVQPSLYEGFGLPLLEHMASGQVVSASNTSSFPEVGGKAVAYFNPTNVDEITAVIHRLLTDRDEYHYRRELGLAQAAKFSWQRAARETRAVYDKLLEA